MRRIAKRGGVCLLACAAVLVGAAACTTDRSRLLTISGSMLGREGEVLRRQLDRFRAAHPGLAVELRATPDAADQRHQLYVQWLNARVSEPDVLQLDVVWTAEFAAAGWIAPIDGFGPPASEFFPASVDAHRWNGVLYALPWFVDVGMLYWRTDLVPGPPRDLDELVRLARAAREAGTRPSASSGRARATKGWSSTSSSTWARLAAASSMTTVVCVSTSRPRSPRSPSCATPSTATASCQQSVLTWQEEQTRFAFQNGQAVFMRNWPYAYALLARADGSAVAGRFAVAPMPAGPGGRIHSRARRLRAGHQRVQRSASRGLRAHRLPAAAGADARAGAGGRAVSSATGALR